MSELDFEPGELINPILSDPLLERFQQLGTIKPEWRLLAFKRLLERSQAHEDWEERGIQAGFDKLPERDRFPALLFLMTNTRVLDWHMHRQEGLIVELLKKFSNQDRALAESTLSRLTNNGLSPLINKGHCCSEIPKPDEVPRNIPV